MSKHDEKFMSEIEEKRLKKMAKRLDAMGMKKCPNIQHLVYSLLERIRLLEARLEKLEKTK